MNDSLHTSKRKLLNDPVYGFITIPDELIFDLIQHPWFQRLRRITQLGLTNLVYGGAQHTRFQHAIGAMHLMTKAIEVIRSKGHPISGEEALGVQIAILLHDIGHGPYSHTLENSLVTEISHEQISLLIMEQINQELGGKLDIAISIFKNEYPKKYLNQLVSSQLDMDRLDYLRRDSFFTGVSEGVIGVERIIKMLNVVDDELLIEAKGIYSIEKFIVARRLMYWQVYLHKTVIAAEQMLVNILRRARELAEAGEELFGSAPLRHFLYHSWKIDDFRKNPEMIATFAQLDDYDIFGAIKVWAHHEDRVLSQLCQSLVDRKLLKIKMQNSPFSESEIQEAKDKTLQSSNLSPDEVSYFVFSDSIYNRAYQSEMTGINLLFKDGTKQDIAQAADLLNISALSKPVTKFFLCYPSGHSI
ncbi:HD domain-containing protein [bacterium SCSIO 12741]|nr:HD domain-containing protein [bacterium SCSIO 12741]